MHPVIIELMVIALVLLFSITQIIIPLVTNTPTFPSFRFKKKLDTLDDLKASEIDAALEVEIQAARKRVNDLRQPSNEDTK